MELPFHWQIMKPMSGEAYSTDSIKCCPDKETAFSILPEKGLLNPHTDNEFILSFSPHEVKWCHLGSHVCLVLILAPPPSVFLGDPEATAEPAEVPAPCLGWLLNEGLEGRLSR